MSLRKWIKSFPVRQYMSAFALEFATTVLKTGPIPKHIAFIMDGNRRFAKQNNLELGEGHIAGFESLGNILQVCYQAGVHTCTVYAFSIENFNRPQHEIDSLFNIIRTKLMVMTEEEQLPANFLIKVRILGDRSLIPDDILEIVLRLERSTQNNTKGVLNICFPYTSRDDITQAVGKIAKKVENNQVQVQDIDQDMLEKEMYTGESPEVSLMIRTSGATRFSDFMIWQCCENCQVEFIETLWPAFTKWEMVRLLAKWGFYETKKLENQEIMQTKRQVMERRKPPVISVTEVDRAEAAAAAVANGGAVVTSVA